MFLLKCFCRNIFAQVFLPKYLRKSSCAYPYVQFSCASVLEQVLLRKTSCASFLPQVLFLKSSCAKTWARWVAQVISQVLLRKCFYASAFAQVFAQVLTKVVTQVLAEVVAQEFSHVLLRKILRSLPSKLFYVLLQFLSVVQINLKLENFVRESGENCKPKNSLAFNLTLSNPDRN